MGSSSLLVIAISANFVLLSVKPVKELLIIVPQHKAAQIIITFLMIHMTAYLNVQKATTME